MVDFETNLNMIIAVVNFFIGYFIGRISHTRRKKSQELESDENKCQCGHGLSFHEENGRCHHVDSWGDKCSCRRYIDKYYVPEITS